LLAVHPIFQFWGTLISYIDESETDFKVQTPVSVKQPTGDKTIRGEGVKEGKDHYCCRDYKRIFKQWYSIIQLLKIYICTQINSEHM